MAVKMQDLQYFSSTFSRPSSRHGSRPHSRAPSDTSFTTAVTANERPESSHSTRSASKDLTREIDHIKALIARSSQSTSQQQSPSQGHSITAQVFRRRSASTSTAAHAHILQELDNLKRRIRQEQQAQISSQQQSLQQQVQSRLAEIDPDASESEAEYEDALDERELEIESAREELVYARLNGEQLLEAAEGKYDAVVGEKEKLEDTLKSYRDELCQSNEQRDWLEQAIRDARSSVRDLNDQNQRVRSDLEDVRQHAYALQTQKEDLERAQEKSLEELRRCIEELAAAEETKNAASKQLQVSQAQVKAAEDARISAIEELESRHAHSLESLQDVLQEDVRRLKKEFEENMSRSVQSHGTAIDELQQARELALEQAKQDTERRLQEQDETHRRFSKLADEKHLIDKEALIRTHEEALLASKGEAELHLLTVRQSGAEENKTLVEGYNAALEKAQNDARVKLEVALKEANEDAREKIKSARDQYESLQASHKQSILGLTESHDKQISSLKAQQQNDLEFRTHEASKELAEVIIRHESRFAALQHDHESQVAALTTALKKSRTEIENQAQAASEARDQFETQIAQQVADSNAHLTEERKSHKNEIVGLREKFNAQLIEHENVANEQKSNAARTEAEHQRTMADLRAAHVKDLQQIAAQNNEDNVAVKAKISAEIEQSRHEFEQANGRLRQAEQTLQSQLREQKIAHQAQVDGLRQEQETALSGLQSSKRDELERMQAVIQQSLEEEIASVTSLHNKQMQKQQSSFDTQLTNISSEGERALADRDSFWEKQIAELNAKHERDSFEALRSSDDKMARRIRDLEEQHSGAMKIALATAHAQADERRVAAEADHRSAMDAALDKMRESSNTEIKKLKKRHQDAVAEVRLIAQAQFQSRLRELEARHQQALDSAEKGLEMAIASHEADMKRGREGTAELHQAELLRLENEFQVRLNEIESRLTQEKSAEMTSKQYAFDAELVSWQARLDATLTGQAEAERALAVARKQNSEGDRRLTEAKSSLGEQLKAMQEEKDELAAQLERARTSFLDLQSKLADDDEGPSTPTPQDPTPNKTPSRRTSMHASEFQIARLEQELVAAQSLAQKRLNEKSEMVRQNDFLIKELEVLLAQRSSKPANPGRRDATVQTEFFMSEPKADQSSMRRVKAEQRSRPSTPLSPEKKKAREEIDFAWHARSFEDYLKQAESELSELGGVITANEALFAQKSQEHVGDLQRAKDQLAADYKSKLDRLAMEKDAMDRVVTVKQQAAFATERTKLIALYGADYGDSSANNALLTSLPVRRAKALRTAEQKLVTEYNRRLARRKSEIALRHAEEFQALTQDYDRSVIELLNDERKSKRDLLDDVSGLGHEPGLADAQFVKDKGQSIHSAIPLVAQDATTCVPGSEHAEEDEEHRSRPLRRPDTSHWTSAPRTAKSLPRSSSQPRAISRTRDRRDTDTASLSSTSKSPLHTEKHPPVPQLSLIRGKNPTDVLPLPKVATSGSSGNTEGRPAIPGRSRGPTIPERRLASLPIASSTSHYHALPTSAPPASTQQDLAIAPAEFERQQVSTSPQNRERLLLEVPSLPQSASKIPAPVLRGSRDRPFISNPTKQQQRSSAPPASPAAATLRAAYDSEPSSPSKAGSPDSSHKASGGSLSRLKNSSKRLSSGLIYWKPPKQSPQMQAFEA